MHAYIWIVRATAFRYTKPPRHFTVRLPWLRPPTAAIAAPSASKPFRSSLYQLVLVLRSNRWIDGFAFQGSILHSPSVFFLSSEKSGALKISFDRTPLMANWGIRGKIDSEFCSAKIFPVKSLSKVTRVERSRPTFKYYRMESDKRDP